MRITQLDFLAFGPFTNQRLRFGDMVRGLHLVFGPNEAGKTSALRALRQLLFGIPHASSDNFLHAHQDLRIGATLLRPDGRILSIVRRKGQKNTLRSATDVEVVSPEELQSLLPNIDEETFRRRFGIDYEELQAGGRAVAEGKGDLGELLFAAGAGVANLGRVCQQLEREAGDLFAPRASKPRINKGIAALKVAREQLREARLPTAAFLQLDEALRQARQDADRVAAALLEKRTTQHRLARFDAAMPLVSDRQRCVAELAQLADAPLLVENAAERRVSAETERNLCRQQLDRIDQELAQLADGLRELHIDEELLAAGDVIESLQPALGSHRKAADDRKGLQARCAELERQAARWLSEILGRTATLDEAATVRLSGRERVRIQGLGVDLQSLSSQLQTVEQQLQGIEARQARTQAEFDQLPPAVECGDLKRAIRVARQHGNLDERVAAARELVLRGQAELDRKARRLTGWQGELASLETLPVPALETIERCEGQLQECERELRRLREHQERTLEVLRDADEQLARLDLEQDVPTEQDLETARQRRDAIWEQIRRLLNGENEPGGSRAEGPPGPADPISAFEHALDETDRLADRLRGEADRVAAKAAALAQQQSARQKLSDQSSAIAKAEAQHADLLRAWDELWRPSGVTPLTPREMRGWLARHGEIVALASQIRQQQGELDQLEQLRQAECRALAMCLAGCGFPASGGGEAESLVRWVEQAEDCLEACEADHTRRERLRDSLRQFAEELPQLQQKRDAMARDLSRVRSHWGDALRSLFLPPDASAAEAHEVLQSLEELRTCEREIDGLRERLRGIDADSRQFQEEVARQLDRLAPDLSGRPPAESIPILDQRLRHARQQSDRRQHLQDEYEKRQRHGAELVSRLEAAQAQLQALMTSARCETMDELPRAEQRSARRQACESELRRLNEQLTRLAGNEPLADFLAAAAQLDADALRSSLAALAAEIQELEVRQQNDATRIGGLEQQFQQLHAGDRAQVLEEEIQQAAASLHRDIEQYSRLRAASLVLRRAIERYRERNQGPILRRASERFAQLTCGSFAGLRVEFGDREAPFLVGIRGATHQTVSVDGMSTGTRDQLYLAIRLASLEHYLDDHPPVPFVLDDILVQFDDDRSAATLGVLAELARRTQVIFFTHHRHLIDLAEKALPSDEFLVHELLPAGSARA